MEEKPRRIILRLTVNKLVEIFLEHNEEKVENELGRGEKEKKGGGEREGEEKAENWKKRHTFQLIFFFVFFCLRLFSTKKKKKILFNVKHVFLLSPSVKIN